MGHLKFTDMGFAKYLKGKTFTFCGTPQYIAPEVIVSAELGEQSGGYDLLVDYYALGILIFELLCGQTPYHDINPRAVYRRVLYASLEIPRFIDSNAKDLIRSLLARNPKVRLGKNGISELKNHPWFKGINWKMLRKREVTPPFIPKFTHAGDTCNFLLHKEEGGTLVSEVDYGDVFKDF